MTTIEQTIIAIGDVLKNVTFVTDPNNIVYDETIDKLGMPDTNFPRLEFYQTAFDNYEYFDNVRIHPLTSFLCQGWFRWDDYEVSVSRGIELAKAMEETIYQIFTLNTIHKLKPPGAKLIPGFEMVHPTFHAEQYIEVSKDHGSFFINFSIRTHKMYSIK